MNTNMKRRVFLKRSLSAGTLGVAVAAGLLSPQAILAAWNETAFSAKSENDAIASAMGDASATTSADITFYKTESKAQNGAVVPVSVKTSIPGVTSIALLVEKNSTPMSIVFNLPKGSLADVSTRLKMGKTGDVIAVVKAGGKLYSARKNIEVTEGGCS